MGIALKGRFLSQQLGEGEINAVGVRGKAEEKVTSADFRGGYLRAVMGGVELDLTEATIEDPPAMIEMTVVMGGAEIAVPGSWKVRIDTGTILGGVDERGVCIRASTCPLGWGLSGAISPRRRRTSPVGRRSGLTSRRTGTMPGAGGSLASRSPAW